MPAKPVTPELLRFVALERCAGQRWAAICARVGVAPDVLLPAYHAAYPHATVTVTDAPPLKEDTP